jgi:hypothetical protein
MYLIGHNIIYIYTIIYTCYIYIYISLTKKHDEFKRYTPVLQFQQIMASSWSPWFPISSQASCFGPNVWNLRVLVDGCELFLKVQDLPSKRDDHHPTNTDLQSMSTYGNVSKFSDPADLCWFLGFTKFWDNLILSQTHWTCVQGALVPPPGYKFDYNPN